MPSGTHLTAAGQIRYRHDLFKQGPITMYRRTTRGAYCSRKGERSSHQVDEDAARSREGKADLPFPACGTCFGGLLPEPPRKGLRGRVYG